VASKAFFMMRLNDHIQYLKKMEAALKGENNFEGTDHRSCKLGCWLHEEGSVEVAEMHNPKVQEIFESILEPHRQFHEAGLRALQAKAAGNDGVAQAAMTEMYQLSAVLTHRLLDLDKQK
jgi:hypothetical protein